MSLPWGLRHQESTISLVSSLRIELTWVTCHADVVAVQQELGELDLGAAVVTEQRSVYDAKKIAISIASRLSQRVGRQAEAPG